MRPLNRLAPAMPVGAYRTFQISAPKGTHFRLGTCAEAGCGEYLRGWSSLIDETTEFGLAQAYYIRRNSGRRFREEKQSDGRTLFAFEPGQKCFRRDIEPGRAHQIRLDRPEIFVVRDGDWRGNPTQRQTRHRNAVEWVENFAEHQDRLRSIQERG